MMMMTTVPGVCIATDLYIAPCLTFVETKTMQSSKVSVMKMHLPRYAYIN